MSETKFRTHTKPQAKLKFCILISTFLDSRGKDRKFWTVLILGRKYGAKRSTHVYNKVKLLFFLLALSSPKRAVSVDLKLLFFLLALRSSKRAVSVD
jgi:hypothetical protein